MSNKEKTLVILTPAFPANESEENWVPSQQVFLHSVKKIFPDLKIIVISFIYPGLPSYTWHGIRVFSFDGAKYKKLKRFLLWRMIWKKLSEINRSMPITAVLSFWCGECALVGHYFGKRNSVKHFTWVCGQDATAKNKMVKFIRPLPGELIAKSDFLADEFHKNHGIRPDHIVTNGIDPSMVTSFSGVRDIDLIAVGSLSVLKQYDIFLEIIAEIKKHFPNIRSVLCGDGEDTSRLKKLSEDLLLTNNLQMTGMLTPKEAIRQMQKAKIFLHPSSYEGFSMACLEALAAGTHVISFVKPMHYNIKNWHVVKTKQEMYKRAMELLTDDKTINESVQPFVIDDISKKMIQLLEICN